MMITTRCVRSFLLTLSIGVAVAVTAHPALSEGSEPRPAVVRVAAEDNGGRSCGSGTLVAVEGKVGLVLTNWHVVRDATGQVSVEFPDGTRSAATVLKVDKTWDLAALLIWRPEVAAVELADEPPKPGDELTIAGYGSGSYREATGKAVQYVSPGEGHPFEIVELSVVARNGDSGGPIFNDKGQMAGVLFGSAGGRTDGSHCGRVRWFVKQAVTESATLSKSVKWAQND